MDILPSGNIFRELQDIHDTGYFSSQASIEDQWQQASLIRLLDYSYVMLILLTLFIIHGFCHVDISFSMFVRTNRAGVELL